MSGYLERHNVKNGKDGRFTRKGAGSGKKRAIAKAAAAVVVAGVASEGFRAVGRSSGLPREDAFHGGVQIVGSQVIYRVGRALDRLLPR